MGFRKPIEMREARVDDLEPLVKIRLRETGCKLSQTTVESGSNAFPRVAGQGGIGGGVT